MTAQVAIPLYVGYDWIIPVKLVDPTTGAPLDISTWTIFGDLWLPGQAVAQAMTLTAHDVDVSAASFKFTVPRSTTATVIEQPAKASSFPCRIMVNYVDGDGEKIALRPIFILPLDPRTSTL